MPTDLRGNETVSLKIGKYDLILSELSQESTKEIDSYVRKRIMAIADESSRDLPASSREDILSIALREASAVLFPSVVSMKHIRTVEGMALLICKMCKRDNPDLKPKDIIEECSKPDVIREINSKIGLLTVTKKEDSNGKDVDSKKKNSEALDKEKKMQESI